MTWPGGSIPLKKYDFGPGGSATAQPAGTPEAVIAKLHAEVSRVLRAPDVLERFAAQGIDVIGGSSAEFAAFIRQDVAKYAKLVKTAGIRID